MAASVAAAITVRVEPPAEFAAESWLEDTSHNRVAFALCRDRLVGSNPWLGGDGPPTILLESLWLGDSSVPTQLGIANIFETILHPSSNLYSNM